MRILLGLTRGRLRGARVAFALWHRLALKLLDQLLNRLLPDREFPRSFRSIVRIILRVIGLRRSPVARICQKEQEESDQRSYLR